MSSATRSGPVLLTITAVVFALIGLFMTVGGGWLIALGGTWYYLIAGLALLVTAWLIFRRERAAMWLYAAILLGTLIWAVAEVGFNFWALVPRGDVLAPLGVWLLLPFIWRNLTPARRGGVYAVGAAVVLCLVVMVVALTGNRTAMNGTIPPTAAASAPPSGQAGVNWPEYGGTDRGDRYSSLSQITPANVKNLKLAWQFQTGDTKGPEDPIEFTNEATPIKVGHLLYTCSPHQIVFALDAATGTLRWKYDPHIVHNPHFQHLTCRGVSYHETRPGATTIDGAPAPSDCPHRLFLPTNDGRMIALNADDGTLCQSFGDHGELNLKQHSPYEDPGFYEGTSPPLVTDKVLIVGGSVIDNYARDVPSGVIRGFDIYSGRLIWAFDAGNPDPNEMPSATHHFTAGSPNSWAESVADEGLGLAYIPLGTGADDQWGGERTPDEERYDSALVALDIATGKLRWSFQNVHHDLWDMDMPSQPSLVTINMPGGPVPAIYAPTKTGDVFVLDRRNGHLIVPAPERPVPQGAAPGDHVAPTQPFSELSFRPRRSISGADMWGATLFDQLACRIQFHSLRYDGIFTPPSVQGTLVFPGDFGMFEWGGSAFDAVRQIGIFNPQAMPFTSTLIPRGPNNPKAPNGTHPPGTESGVQPMYGVPFGVKLAAFLSPVGLPCLQPPWGYMAAVDLKTNKIIWQHRIGTVRDMAPVPLPFKLGTPMLGGPITTAGGVAFETGTMDYYIRAFDVRDGTQLWQDRLPAGGQSTPMSYEEGGKQYIVTVDGGHGSFGTKLGDYVRAYALGGGQ